MHKILLATTCAMGMAIFTGAAAQAAPLISPAAQAPSVAVQTVQYVPHGAYRHDHRWHHWGWHHHHHYRPWLHR